MFALNSGFFIRLAKPGEQADIEHLDIRPGSEQQLAQSILNRCLLVAQRDRRIVGCAGIDLDLQQIDPFFLAPDIQDEKLIKRLLEAAEKLAVQFGILRLGANLRGDIRPMLSDAGYTPDCVNRTTKQTAQANSPPLMNRAFPRRQTRYFRQIFKMLDDLGIDRNYPIAHRLPLQPEANSLQSIGEDIYQRDQRMVPSAAKNWHAMINAATQQGIQIQAVSAFRSVRYQAGIVKRKLEKGQSMEQILEVSAAPGFSEHHTGKAIDVTTPGFDVLEEEFDQSPAFGWLEQEAQNFGFQMSFSKNNHHGLAYEPWHWAWNG
jgi:D-alanyl-D-alanine carboxypeptidase